MKKKYLLSYIHGDGDGVPMAMAVVVELTDLEATALKAMLDACDPDTTMDAALEVLEAPIDYNATLAWIEEHGGL